MITWLELNKLVQVACRTVRKSGRSYEVSVPADLTKVMNVRQGDKVVWYKTHEDPCLVVLKFEKGHIKNITNQPQEAR